VNKKAAKPDDRFAKAAYDPKFLTPSSKVTKVKIDKRFSKMMNDPSFKTNSAIDRYGRKINPDEQNNELKQYYYMEDE
jgi:predicted ATPase